MGKWRYHRFFAGCIDMGQFGISWDISEEHNEGKIITAHNADCDAYENQIADLEEERDAAVEFAHTVEREFAAVSAERDGLKKRNDVQAEQLIRIDREISPLMSEVAELKAERDAARAELAEARAALEAELTAEVAENVRLRTREVGDEVGNLLQEVADLKNELARVKAESLRVVPDGEECNYSVWLEQQSSTAFLLDDDVNVHVSINRYQSADGGPSAHIDGDTPVQPVRLERWEASHDHH